jgi:signal transduction histidine kinase
MQEQRLEALRDMTSALVHDLNNVLTPLLSASDFIVENPDVIKNKKNLLGLLASMRSAAGSARDMMEQLRGFYCPEVDGQLAHIDINPLVKQTLTLAEQEWTSPTGAHGVTIEAQLSLGQVSPILMCEAHFAEMLRNLIRNAAEAMPRGGVISVLTYERDGEVFIVVQDTGRGMTPTERLRCFEPFFSTKRRKRAGMGLARVYGIVKRFGGTIEMESEEWEGTAVTVTFPASPP